MLIDRWMLRGRPLASAHSYDLVKNNPMPLE